MPWTEETGRPQSTGLQRVRKVWACTHHHEPVHITVLWNWGHRYGPLAKEIKHVNFGSTQPSGTSQEWRWAHPGRTYGEFFCLMVCIPLTFTEDWQGFWECYSSRETTSLDWEGQRREEMKGEWVWGQNQEFRGQSRWSFHPCGWAQRTEHQATEDYSQASKLMEFDLLHCELALDWLTFF